MARSTRTGPALGGFIAHQFTNKKTTGSPTNSCDIIMGIPIRIYAVSGCWSGAGATTQFNLSAFDPDGGITSPHVPTATEMTTVDGLAHGAASAQAFTSISNNVRNVSPSMAAFPMGIEITLILSVDGTVPALAATFLMISTVKDHRYVGGTGKGGDESND